MIPSLEARRMTANDQVPSEPKVKVPYWHLESRSELCFKQPGEDRTGGKGDVALSH